MDLGGGGGGRGSEDWAVESREGKEEEEGTGGVKAVVHLRIYVCIVPLLFVMRRPKHGSSGIFLQFST